MADSRTSEKSKLNMDIARQKRRGKARRRKRLRRIHVLLGLFSLLLIAAAAVIVINCISRKEALRNAGLQAFRKGSYVEAEKDFTDSLSEKQWFSSRMDADTRLYLAAAEIRNGDYSGARQQYRKLLDEGTTVISRTKLEESYGFADALSKCESGTNPESCLQNLQQEYDRGNISAALYLGACYGKLGDRDQMISCFQDYIGKAGWDTAGSFLAYELSSCCLESGDLDLAAQYIEKGLTAKDSLYLDLVRYNEVVLYEKQQDYETAYNKAERLIQDYPGEETFRREYDFLDTRVHINPVPVHTKGDADEAG